MSTDDYLPHRSSSETIMEEDENGNEADHSPSSEAKEDPVTHTQLAAASSLRIHELLALFTCFLGPVLGCALLHTIRTQLSRPSEGLVSNYNLTIFLLASELRPLSHLIKLVQNHTLHLQRVVAANPHLSRRSASDPPSLSPSDFSALLTRVSTLESKAINGKPTSPTGSNSNPASPSTPSTQTLIHDVRKLLQPDIDALNRAVRRYEKRATLFSLQMDGRLQSLETRVNDTLALAAAAERSAATNRKGSAGVLMDWVCAFVVKPVQIGIWALGKVIEWPMQVGRWALINGEGFVRRVVGDRVALVLFGGKKMGITGVETTGKARVRNDKSSGKAKRLG